MSKSSNHPMKQIADLLGRRLSTATILFHAAVAERMGVSVTDAKCRSLLLQHGRMTAGDLARRAGLTTGAVTGVIDRLERARLVRRADDPSDRRRVVVEVVSNLKRDREISRLFEPMGTRVVRLATSHDERVQATLVEFLTKVSEILEEETARLQARHE
jgi:DNA-binding MarR family transcriptional regulator